MKNHVKARNGEPHEEDVVAINWIIMPLLNPDGYEYSHTHDRMWRKSRAPIDGASTRSYIYLILIKEKFLQVSILKSQNQFILINFLTCKQAATVME